MSLVVTGQFFRKDFIRKFISKYQFAQVMMLVQR